MFSLVFLNMFSCLIKSYRIIVLLILISEVTSFSQSMLKVRDVFDFDINDEFHHKTLNIPPNKIRIKIIGKYFSSNNDTVFYIRQYNNYWSTAVMTPTPHLVYGSSIGIDTVFYTNLDSLMDAYFNTLTNDSCNYYHDTLFYSATYCNALIYEQSYSEHFCFEGTYGTNRYGKGLGMVEYHYAFPAQFYYVDQIMTYYKKGNIECGEPDTASFVSVDEYSFTSSINISPNPFNKQTTIISALPLNNATIYIENNLGQIVRIFHNINGSEIIISRENLSDGIYYLKIVDKNGFIISAKKIIISE
ncbi:MAG: hypothetical protein KatS3mg027_0827 [Bacteroidia bacterium]|nr:MAG: hypothetical protein KatS3mg027_0827 [Bacteroidia bacterium]